MPRHPGPAFSAVLDKLMTTRGLHNSALARDLDVSPTQISRWRRGLEVPSIGRIEMLAAYFKVDREFLERLAGWRDNTVASAPDTIDPAMSAMLESESAELEKALRGIPSQFWPAYIATQRQVRNFMLQVAGISNPESDELAAPDDTLGQDQTSSTRARKGGLTATLLTAAGL